MGSKQRRQADIADMMTVPETSARVRPGPYCSAISASSRRSCGAARRGVRAVDHDQFGSERAEPLDLLHVLDGVIGAESAQRRPLQQPIGSCLGDRSQVLTLRPGRSSPAATSSAPTSLRSNPVACES